MQRIQSEHRGVIGVVVTNSEGAIIRSTFNSAFDVVENYQTVIVDIVDRARHIIRDNDELTFLKIRTKRVEYIVVPGTCNARLSTVSVTPLSFLNQTRTTRSSPSSIPSCEPLLDVLDMAKARQRHVPSLHQSHVVLHVVLSGFLNKG